MKEIKEVDLNICINSVAVLCLRGKVQKDMSLFFFFVGPLEHEIYQTVSLTGWFCSGRPECAERSAVS